MCIISWFTSFSNMGNMWVANDIVLEKKMQIQSKATYLICKKKKCLCGLYFKSKLPVFSDGLDEKHERNHEFWSASLKLHTWITG